MDILQILPYFSPKHGGSATSPYQISRALSKRGHNVTIYTTDLDTKKSSFEINSGLRVIQFHCVANIGGLLITPAMGNQLKNEIKDFEVIHAHNFRTYQNIIVQRYARKCKVPYILQAQGSMPKIGKKKGKWFYDQLLGFKILKNASKVLALTETEAKQYKQAGIPSSKIVIIPNGIDLSEYNDLPLRGMFRAKFGINEDNKIILFLGRLHWIKGIDNLLRAFARLKKGSKFDNILLVLAGPDDGFLSTLNSLINKLRIKDSVLITGPLYDREKLEAYIDADIYILPSRYETFPMTVLEAIACETPIILSDKCGITATIKDKVGIVVKPSPKEIQIALLQLLSDEDLQKRFRDNCRIILKQFDIANIAVKLEKLYNEVIEVSDPK
ncbi:glycosyltransferase [Candidatus Borrarchaeum sp.]|uniref:glycosyltransferase n=1 Tax=Candidatus Borrarchaeum sp. TaxID=2846742 RepID=UPI00257D7C6D|nr:glycosyltransferase [Candidatus Borrarchaeum sp.]